MALQTGVSTSKVLILAGAGQIFNFSGIIGGFACDFPNSHACLSSKLRNLIYDCGSVMHLKLISGFRIVPN